MMNRLIKIGFGILMLGCFAACNNGDDNDGVDPFLKPEGVYDLTKGYGTINNGASDSAPAEIILVLSNAPGNSATSYTGPGQFFSVKLMGRPEVDKPSIPDGTYSFDKATLEVGEYSYFTMMTASQSKSYMVKEGNVTVSAAGKNYTISGTLKSEDGEEFRFEYFGALDFTDNRTPYTPDTFNEASLHYYNRYVTADTATSLYCYVATFGNAAGDVLSLEFTADVNTTGYYSKIAGGTYDIMAVPEGTTPKDGTLILGENTFMTIGDTRYDLTEGSMTITPDSKFTSYQIKGMVYAGTANKFDFDFQTALPVDKATITTNKLKADQYGISYYAFTSYMNYFMFKNGPTESVFESLTGIGEYVPLYVKSGPPNRYYDYYPTPNGRYTVIEESEAPWHIVTNYYESETGVFFGDKNGNGTQHSIMDGYIDLECEADGNKYKYKVTGKFDTEVIYYNNEKYFTEPEGKKMEIFFEFDGPSVKCPAGGFWWNLHPTSTLTADISPTFTVGAMDWYKSGFWKTETGKDHVMAVIYLATNLPESGWFEWMSDEDARDWRNKYLMISLLLPASADQNKGVIPEGRYEFDDVYSFNENTFMPGFRMSFTNQFWGTHYLNGTYSEEAPIGYGVDGGYVDIARNGNVYTVEYKLYDDRKPPLCRTITGTFTGELPDINANLTGAGSGAVKSAAAGRSIYTISAHHRYNAITRGIGGKVKLAPAE